MRTVDCCELACELLRGHHMSAHVHQHHLQDIRVLRCHELRYCAIDLFLLPRDWITESRRDRHDLRERDYTGKSLVLSREDSQAGTQVVRRWRREDRSILQHWQLDGAILGACVPHEASWTAERPFR
jgi:hypothetical protein